MPYRHHTSQLRRHKPSRQAVVTLNGTDHYLGSWPASKRKPPEAVRDSASHQKRRQKGLHPRAYEDPAYRLFLADSDGSNAREVKTGQRFHLMPSWSPDGSWVLFVAGERYDCHPHVIKTDGTDLKKLASRNGYRGVIDFLDVYDFHDGSSDLPVWAADSKSVFYTAKVDLMGSARLGYGADAVLLSEAQDESSDPLSAQPVVLRVAKARDGAMCKSISMLFDHRRSRFMEKRSEQPAEQPASLGRGRAKRKPFADPLGGNWTHS